MPSIQTKESFASALSFFRKGKLEDALKCFNSCIQSDPNSHQLFDARAATFERLKRYKEALSDARKVIELAPEQAKGYIRSARLFLRLNKLERSLNMCALAVERLSLSDKAKRAEIAAIRDEAVAAIQAREAADAPLPICHVHKLPYELLSIVFFEWMDHEVAAPILASHVCRRWREIAISNSRLWTTLTLGRSKPELKAATWLKRSRGRCMDLRIPSDFQLSVDRQEWFADLIHTFDESRPRRLELSINQTLRDIIFDNLSSRIYETLHELVLQVSLKNPQGNAAFSVPPFISLRRLELHGYVRIPAELASRTLEVLVIKSIYSCATPAATFRRIVTGLPNLRELSLKSPVPSSGTDASLPPSDDDRLVLGSLESMELNGPGNWLAFSKNMEVPSLRRLRLDHCTRLRAAEFLANLKLNDSVLEELEFCSTSLDEPWLRSHMASYHNLNTLEISRSMDLSNALIEDLAERSCWPRLQHVKFTHSTRITGSPLLRLVRSHLPPPEHAAMKGETTTMSATLSDIKPIQTLIVDGCPKIDNELALKMAQLVPDFSCVYLTKEQAAKRRRTDP